jgi:uncharacterized membrane protein SpoIIM required for sporulation
MRETDFIKQNKDKWETFEKTLSSFKSDPEALARVFVETTDDLSYARTHYRNRSVRVYLNGLSQQIYQLIYKNKRGTKRFRFWTHDLPLSMYRSRPELALSFIIFALAIFIGAFSSHYESDFLATILGEGYVEMTEENIAKGDPMGVYKSMNQMPMFLHIAWNNLRVSYLVFVVGVFFSVGTIMALISNGVMVGAFMFFFFSRGLGSESMLTVMMHGSIELSCIVLAGTAGIALGKGLVIPETYTRMQAFLLSSRKGIVMMLGITPFIVLAALIEGFVTRMTEVNDILRAAIILASFFMMIWYFVILPWKLFHRKEQSSLSGEQEIKANNAENSEFHSIKNAAQLLSETFQQFRSHLKPALWLSALAALISTLLFGLIINWQYSEHVYSDYFFGEYNPFEHFVDLFWWPDDLDNFFDYTYYTWLLPLNIVVFAMTMLHVGYTMRQKWQDRSFIKYFLKNGWKAFLWAIALHMCLKLDAYLAVAICFFVIGPLGMIIMGSLIEGSFKSAGEAWKQRAIPGFGIFAALSVFQFIMVVLVNAPLSYFVFDFLFQNLNNSGAIASQAPFVLYYFISMLAIYLLIRLNFYLFAFQFGSSLEATNAKSLRQKISSIRKKSNAYGIERE